MTNTLFFTAPYYKASAVFLEKMDKQKLYIGLLFVISVVLSTPVFGDTLTVKQDGTGDYVKIQDAIDNAANGTDIIVYPGTYYENLNFNGKTLTLASTYLLNPVDSLVWQTVIDGNQNGSCIMLVSNESTCRIVGFTIQHGNGTIYDSFSPQGGGILIQNNSTITIEHCLIQNNSAIGGGGGIMMQNSNVFLIGNTIRYNQTNYYGGGLKVSMNSNLIFNDEDLNSLYLNYAELGTDLQIDYTCNANHLIIDTATVLGLNHYYLASTNMFSYPYNGISFETNFGIIEQENNDLFVSPDGDNSNSGLSENEPLKNIAYALLKVMSDSTKTNTIHLANGTYSPSQTGEKFPLSFKSNVSISGQSRENTILDAEYRSAVGLHPAGGTKLLLEKLTVKYGLEYKQPNFYGGIWSRGCQKITIDSLAFLNCRGLYTNAFTSNSTDTIVMSNCLFENNKGIYIASIYANDSIEYTNFELSSTRFLNNAPDTTDESCHALFVYGRENLAEGKGKAKGNLINCEFSGNKSDYSGNLPSSSGFDIYGHVNVNIINSTFADNIHLYAPYGTALGILYTSQAHIYNSIFYGNMPYQAYMPNNAQEDADTMYIYNSCIENESDGIINLGPYNYLYYDDQTNISNDPEWFGQGEFPYMIGSGSPCIDAGTLDLPEGIELPEYDLAGNPRIYGESVDMGAYEWSPVGIGEYQPNPKQKEKLLKAAPNPFRWETTITAKYEHQGKVKIAIYNNYGQQVKVLLDLQTSSGRSEMHWTGNDDNNNPLPKGVYHIVMYFDDKEVEAIKVVKQ